LELLKRVIPTATRIAVFADLNDPMTRLGVQQAAAMARSLGVKLAVYKTHIRSQLEYAFRQVTRRRPDGLVVQQTSANRNLQKEIVEFAAGNRLPAVYATPGAAEAGGLMSYVPSHAEIFRRAATLVDKILKGAKPADLPVEHPTKFELVINLRTAKALGLMIPRSLLLRADRVVE
jgi:putative ABC transport system substrate-binding protein